jgi:molecular chaperone DnaK (HSP70)
VSLVDISGPTLTVAEHHCEDACGSERIEELLVSYCLAEFKRQHPLIKINIATDVYQALTIATH